jgi:hypothetical protein
MDSGPGHILVLTALLASSPPSLACVLLCFNVCFHISIAVFGIVWHAVELCAYEVYSIILDVSSMLHMT